MCTSLPGFEPGIFWSVVRRVIRCATSPVLTMARFSFHYINLRLWVTYFSFGGKYELHVCIAGQNTEMWSQSNPHRQAGCFYCLQLAAFLILTSVWACKALMKLCVQCQYCLHCESNHSFRWMPIALKDWTYILGGLAADVFQEKCEQNEKVLARRIWTTDLRISSWYFQLQSSALPTDLSRDA